MLKKNDIVDIVSPGTSCNFREIEKIKNYVKKIGLKPRIFLEKETSLAKTPAHEFAAIAPEKRFAQLKKSIENSDSKIIWCTRGGYGSAELLPFLMKMKKPTLRQAQDKIFIGFSDISSLNIFFIQQWNWKIISAPMLIQLALKKVSTKSEKALLDFLFGRKKELNYELTSLTPYRLQLTAKIIGGCASVIVGSFGTKNQIDWNGKILFLEDEGEDGERLDRYFHQITTIINESGKKPRAILLGNFLEANPHGTPKAKNIEMAIERFSKKLGKIPLLTEKTKSLGHSKNMLPLLLGHQTKIIGNNLIQK